MSYAIRVKGGLICETKGEMFFIGHPKEPCRFAELGFADPGEITAPNPPWVKLAPAGAELPAIDSLSGFSDRALMSDTLSGAELADKMAEIFMIHRNGSISERLWGLMAEYSPKTPKGEIDARWLSDTPDEVWEIVRDQMLRC